jgi:general secretion pathway protein D
MYKKIAVYGCTLCTLLFGHHALLAATPAAPPPEAEDFEQPPPAPITPQPGSPQQPFGSPATPGQPVPNQPPVARPPSAPATGVANAPAVPPLKPGEVMLNFQAADIQAVIKAVSQMTNRNFLLDPRVKGQVTILSARPMSAASAYQVFLSALKAQGFTAVEGPGNVVRVIPTAEAKLNADVSERDAPRGGEQIVTHVAAGQNVSVTQLVPILRPLMAPTSQLSAYEPANVLIITDYADNVRRLLRIIDKIDQPSSGDVNVIPLKHASVLDIADVVARLATTAPGAPGAQPGQVGVGGERFTIVPDLRTNSLLVRTENPGRLAQIRSLIEKLDVPAKPTGNTRVVYLKNAEAAKVAEVLRGLIAGEARAAQAAPAAGAAAVARPITARAEASLIQADEATNSIIISASDAVYNSLRSVIEQLDVRRAQVYVEALIVEMSTDKVRELGFQWAAAGSAGDGAIGGLQNFPGANPPIVAAAADPVTALGLSSGLSLAFVGEKITLPDGTQVRGLGALARALESKNLANVLSTPNLMTLDNAEAKIVVGQNVPFITGSFAQATGTTGTVNPFTTVERKDVGLTLKIKPQISDGGTIRLDIFQEVSSVAPTATALASDLITNKRSIETKVVVDDANTIVLGGLIEDTVQDGVQAVPLLGDIPLLGALFRFKSQTTKKTNLMVFLRPTIVRSVQDGYQITVDRYEYLRTKTGKPDPEREQTLNRFAPIPPAPPKENATKKPPEPAPGEPPTGSP